MTGGQIHWFPISKSRMVTMLPSGMVPMIILRNSRRDVTKFRELASAEDAAEELCYSRA